MQCRRAVDAGAAVVVALGALTACGDTSQDGAGPSPAAAATVDIVDFAFAPRVITVTVGEGLTFVNGDDFAHTAQAGDGTFDTGDIGTGRSSAPVVFDAPGRHDFFCGIHTYMTGTVTVAP
jgi:plastocyanin